MVNYCEFRITGEQVSCFAGTYGLVILLGQLRNII